MLNVGIALTSKLLRLLVAGSEPLCRHVFKTDGDRDLHPALAVAPERITVNPVRQVKAYKVDGTGFHTWDKGEIERFFEVHEPAWLAHRAVTLLLYTVASRFDALALGSWNMKRDRIWYRRQKTARGNGQLVSIPLYPAPAEPLADLPSDRPYPATAYGKPRSPDVPGNAVRGRCDTAGLSTWSSHGLRKAYACRLAQAGATAHEIMSVTGHKTRTEVQRYTESAAREGRADSAMDKLPTRPDRRQTVVNLPDRVATEMGQGIEIKRKRSDAWQARRAYQIA